MPRHMHLVALAVLLFVGVCGCGRGERPVLRLYCGAGMRPPVAELAAEFGRDRGVVIESDYGGSAVLLSRIKLSREGDLYIPGDVRYVQQARADGLIASSVDACYSVPVILVANRAAKPVRSLADLAAPGLRVGLGEPTACAIGEVTKEILDRAGIGEQVQANVVFNSLTVNELGLQIKSGKLDATIVWDAIARQYANVAEIVEIERDANVISTIPVAVLESSRRPELAREFQKFVTSERGREIWARHGFTASPPG
jgi:molybdate transport system substrate-binding protein